MMSNFKNEAREAFQKDCMDKKVTARSASKKVSHSGCRLPTHSKDEIRAMTGPVITYNLKRPMDWRQFTSLPGLQRDYLEELARRYRVSETELPNLFGARWQAVSNYLSNHGILGVMRDVIQALPEGEQEPLIDEWRQFCASLWDKPNQQILNTPAVVISEVLTDACEAFKQYRMEHNLTQRALAEQLGCNAAAVSLIENKRASAVTCNHMMDRLNRLNAAESFIPKKVPVVTTTPVVAKDSDKEQLGIVVQTKAVETKQEPQNTTGNVLTLSGSAASVLGAIAKLFAKGKDISVRIEY